MHQFGIYAHHMTTLRAMVTYALFLLASLLLRIALKLLPKDHPGRIYATGRWKQGHERIGSAIGSSATARYVADRRRRAARMS